jgi:hypothetical protein
MSNERSLTFDEMVGHLRELNARVVVFEIRDDQLNVIGTAEGELGDLSHAPQECSFTLGADPRQTRTTCGSSLRAGSA